LEKSCTCRSSKTGYACEWLLSWLLSFCTLQVSGQELVGGRLSYPIAVGQNDAGESAATKAAGGGGGGDGTAPGGALPTTLASEGDGEVAQNLDWELKVRYLQSFKGGKEGG
jgi:hypothetical protein